MARISTSILWALALATAPSPLWGQAPTHVWSQVFGGTSSDAGYSCAVDGAGNVLVTGYFTDAADFGGSSLSANGRGVFLAKYAADGAHTWSQGFGLVSGAEARAVSADGEGNVAISGFYDETIAFGGGPLTSTSQSVDVFVARFDSNGTHSWSKSFGDARRDEGGGVAADASGNVYVSGYFDGSVDFGGGAFLGFDDIFVAKYDPTGTHVWSKHLGVSTFSDRGRMLSLDPSGNPAVTGLFQETVDFGGGPVMSAGSLDMFVAKYDANGNHLLSGGYGGLSNDQGYGVATDAAGNVIVTGRFAGTAQFGGDVFTSAGDADVFVAKYDAAGDHVWSRAFGSSGRDLGLAVAVDELGSVFVTGSFSGTVNFGGGALTSAGGTDIFVAVYDTGGNHIWSQRFGDGGDDVGQGIAIADAELVVTGSFGGTVDFGGGPLTSNGDTDVFVAKYDFSTVPTTLKDFDAAWVDDHVAISWRLIDVRGALSFQIARRAGGDEPFVSWADATIVRNEESYVLEDRSTLPGKTYTYRVVVLEEGAAVTSFEVSVTTPRAALLLEQNRPNPFNPRTSIDYSIDRDAQVRLTIYDVDGHRVVTLVDRRLGPGAYSVEWDGRDAHGNAVAGGVYFYRLDAGGHMRTRKAILLK
ncbi:MAG: hypothetical protein JSW67_04980 [Candidatus Latescibacterota bacterium]|nr:MAG: hypothetical protein JSW67_04980 [Candidatus Latescibacterota bacterium]